MYKPKETQLETFAKLLKIPLDLDKLMEMSYILLKNREKGAKLPELLKSSCESNYRYSLSPCLTGIGGSKAGVIPLQG